MKRSLAVVLLLVISLPLTGCAAKADNGGNNNNDTDNNGGGAIEFHNSLLEFRKLAVDPLDKTIDTLNNSVDWIEREGVTHEKPRWNFVLLGINPYEKLAKIDISAPPSFSNDDRRLFDEGIAQIKKETGELDEIIDSLTAYYNAEDYKDDKHQKIKDLQPLIELKVAAIMEASQRMGERSEELASIEERRYLEQDPLGIYILAMRDLNAKAEEQMEILMDDRLLREGSGTSFTDASKAAAAVKVKDLADAAEESGKEVAALLESARKLDPGTLENRTVLLDDYQDFLEEVEEQQGEVRKTIRYIREWGHIGNENDMKMFYDTIGDLWGAHNRFIDSVNKGN
jgi:hypothetical protein